MDNRRATDIAKFIDMLYKNMMINTLSHLNFFDWNRPYGFGKGTLLWQNLMLDYEEYKDLPPLCDIQFDPKDFS